MKLTKICPFCEKQTTIIVDGNQYIKYQQGEMVQDTFPNLPASKREIIMTGICFKCQKKVFAEPKE